MDTGISTLVDLDVPMNELAGMIADAGFTHISLSHDVGHAGYHRPDGRQKLLKLWDKLGIKLNYIHPPLHSFLDLTSQDKQVRRTTIELMKMTLEATSELGGNSITLHMANDAYIGDDEFAPRIKHGLDSIRELVDFASNLNVVVAIENLPLTMDSGRLSQEIIEQSEDIEGAMICLDACHATMENPQAIDMVRRMAKRVHTTHFSDTLGTMDSHLIPGQGNVDFDSIAKVLGEAGFNGIVDLECSVWMLRRRHDDAVTDWPIHPDDPRPIDTVTYLKDAHRSAVEIGEKIEQVVNTAAD